MNTDNLCDKLENLMHDDNANMNKKVMVFNADSREWEPIVGAVVNSDEIWLVSEGIECDHGIAMSENCSPCDRVNGGRI
jgi:hypothetical protein